MSKHETWRTRQYWQSVGGLLIEEFLAIPLDRENGTGKRLIDGVIVLGETPPSTQKGGRHDFTNKDIIVVQTKAGGLGMSLMGQAFFSKEIMQRYNPKSIKTVALCGKGDLELEKLCRKHDIEVVVIEGAGSVMQVQKSDPEVENLFNNEPF